MEEEVSEWMSKVSLSPRPIHLSGPTSTRKMLLTAVWNGQIEEVRSLVASAALGRLDWEDAWEMAKDKGDANMQTVVKAGLVQHPKLRAHITDWMVR